MGDEDIDDWLAICGGAGTKEEEEDTKPDTSLKKRKGRRVVADIELPAAAPLYTDDGELTLWGVIQQNHDSERRKQRRRQDQEKKRRLIKDQEALEERRLAILEETEGNEFLADLFCNIPPPNNPLEQKSGGGGGLYTEETDNDPDVKRNTFEVSKERVESRCDDQEELVFGDGVKADDDLDIFANSHATVGGDDPVGLIYGGVDDQLTTILGGEVEVIEGSKSGRLNPFPGAYKKGKQHVWTPEETEIFHQGLARFGTDFMLIKNMLAKAVGAVDISEKDIVSKYKREIRRNLTKTPLKLDS